MNKAIRHIPTLSRVRYWAAASILACAFSVSAQTPPTAAPAATPTTAPMTTSPPAAYSARTLVAGRDYLVLAKPMPAPADRVELTYFFWYNSPASAKLDPLIRQWVASRASPLVKFRPLPAVLENSWGYGARLFFALQELDKEATLGPRLMQAMDTEVVDYNSPKSLSDWMRDQGVPLKKLQDAVNSPRVLAQTSWMPSLMKRYGVERVPTVVIDGQFLFIAGKDEKPETFMSRVDYAAQVLTQRKLVEMARQRQKQKRGS